MFDSCSSLTTLNLSNFDISLVTDMGFMFSGCSSLKSLNLMNFYTLSTTSLQSMFQDCSSQKSLNLSNFNISQSILTSNFLNGCISLEVLDLSSIHSLSLQNLINRGELKLKYLILNNDTINNNIDININLILNITARTGDLCFGSTYNVYNFNKLKSDTCIIHDCSNDWFKIRKKISKENKECYDNCNNSYYEYDGECYKDCPLGTKKIKSFEYFCEKICQQETPFLIIDEQKCISNCNIKDIIDKKCVIHIEENIYSKYNEANLMLQNLLNEIKKNFQPEIIKEKGSILIEENEVIFEITTMDYLFKNNSHNNEIARCENNLQTYYNMPQNEPIYLFNIYTNKNSSQKIIEVFRHSNETYSSINLDICQDIFDISERVINCSQYSIESINNGECISCKEGYYPLNDESSTIINSFIKCYKSIEGYYFDEITKKFNPCYHSCKVCGDKGYNINSHNCVECKNEYIYEYKQNNTEYLNCYKTCPNQETNSYSFCDIEPKCEKINKFLVNNENRCVDNCTEINKYEYQNICYDNPQSSITNSEFITHHYDEKTCTEDKPYKIISTQECT